LRIIVGEMAEFLQGDKRAREISYFLIDRLPAELAF
jgi:hypothetical protein